MRLRAEIPSLWCGYIRVNLHSVDFSHTMTDYLSGPA